MIHLLFAGLVVGQPVASGLPVTPDKPVAADCQHRLEHAYDLLDQLKQQQTRQQGIIELRFTSGTTYRPAGQQKLTTTTAHFTMLSKANRGYLSNGEVDLYQDGQVQVSIIRAQRLILITSAQAQLPDAFARLLKMREQLKTQAVVSQCTLQAAKGRTPARRFLEARPLPGSAMTGKVASIAYWLDPRTDAFQQIIMYYPTGAGVHSASLVVDSQRIKAQDEAVDLPALRHVFGSDNQLLPAYRSFTVQDQRHS